MSFPDGSVGKEYTCNAGNTGDVGSIPGLGRSLEEGMATCSRILAWRIPMDRVTWLQSMGITELDTTEATEHAHMSR